MSVLSDPVKPGTVLIVIAIAAIGFFLYNWASTGFKESGTELRKNQEEIIDCNSVEVSFREIKYREDANIIYFSTNADVPNLYVETEKEIVKISDVKASDINNVDYIEDETNYVAFKSNDCVFRNFTFS